MRYFPVSIDTRDKKAIVLGAGKISTRKIKSLLDSELKFIVYALNFTDELVILSKEYPKRIELIETHISKDFCFLEADLLLIATNDKLLNDYIELEANNKKVPYLRLDNKSNSSFILNKVITKNNLTFTISTDAKLPFLTKIIEKDISTYLDCLDYEKINLLIAIREKLKANNLNTSELLTSLYIKDKEDIRDYLEHMDEN